jgi:long-chain acyl-CoA synthetase
MSAFAHIKTNPPFATIADLWDKRTEERSDKTYLHFQDRGDSYGSMRAAIARAAGMLKGLGAEKGNHVALLIPNSPEFLYLWFGAMTGGFTAVTINTLLKAEELEFIINDCDARILVTTPQFRKALEPVWSRLTAIQHVVLTTPDADFPQTRDLTTELAAAAEFTASDLAGGDKASMIYTSGTTGHPKGVLLTHANILYNSYVTHQMIDLEPADTALCIMPLFHVNAQIASMMSTLWAGATVVLEDGFKPRSFIDTLKKYRCTTFSGVPTIYNFLNELKEAEGQDLSFLKACICGAAPMPVEVSTALKKNLREKSSKVMVFQRAHVFRR